VALARRELWHGNGQRLFRVAVELAVIALGDDAGNDDLDSQVITTLQQALAAGYQPEVDMQIDPQFRDLLTHQQFRDLTRRPNKKMVASGPHL